MSNLCNTTIVYNGGDTADRWRVIDELKLDTHPNGHQILENLNLPSSLCLVGNVRDYHITNDNEFVIELTDSWSPQLELWKRLPEMLDVNMELSYKGIETGEDIFCCSSNYSHDDEKFYFYLETEFKNGELLTIEDFYTVKDEILKEVNKKMQKKFTTFEDLIKWCKKMEDEECNFFFNYLERDIVEIDEITN